MLFVYHFNTVVPIIENEFTRWLLMDHGGKHVLNLFRHSQIIEEPISFFLWFRHRLGKGFSHLVGLYFCHLKNHAWLTTNLNVPIPGLLRPNPALLPYLLSPSQPFFAFVVEPLSGRHDSRQKRIVGLLAAFPKASVFG